MTAQQGWRRIPGHVILFAFPFIAIGYVGEEWNLFGPYSLAVLTWPLVGISFLIILLWEIYDIRKKKHGLVKAAIDFASKLVGVVIGLTCWLFWYL